MTSRYATLGDFVVFLASLDGVFDAPPPAGDPVDLLRHGLRCADLLRRERPADIGLQLAGLVHDVGHATGDGPDHARAGADAVRPLLGDLVGTHVEAKRYLAAVEPDYHLSPASTSSLGRQGGAMTPDERDRFAARAGAADAVLLRRADQGAKIVGRIVPGLDVWVPRLLAYAAR